MSSSPIASRLRSSGGNAAAPAVVVVSANTNPVAALLFGAGTVGIVAMTVLLVSLPCLCLDGFVVQCYWKWFALAVFPSLRALTLVEASGLYLFVQCIATQVRVGADGHIQAGSFKASLEKALLFLVVGYAMHCLQ